MHLLPSALLSDVAKRLEKPPNIEIGVQAWYVQNESLGVFGRMGPHGGGQSILDWKVPAGAVVEVLDHREQKYSRICAGNHAVTRFVRPLVKAVGHRRPGPPWHWVTRRVTYEHGSGSLLADEPEPGTGLLQKWSDKKIDRQLPAPIPKDTITDFYFVEKPSCPEATVLLAPAENFFSLVAVESGLVPAASSWEDPGEPPDCRTSSDSDRPLNGPKDQWTTENFFGGDPTCGMSRWSRRSENVTRHPGRRRMLCVQSGCVPRGSTRF